MKQLNYILYGTIIICSCATLKHEPETLFSFYYYGKEVFIGSKNYPKGGGDPYNIIVSDELNLKAVDYYQDMTIDDVVQGNLTIKEVQKIYSFGLEAATQKGKLIQREWEFIFMYSEGETTYEIRTYRPYNDLPYNDFYISKPLKQIIKAVDLNCDGTIEYISQGNKYSKIGEIQKEYMKILYKGINQDRIKKDGGLYHVKPRYPSEKKEDKKKIIIQKESMAYH